MIAVEHSLRKLVQTEEDMKTVDIHRYRASFTIKHMPCLWPPGSTPPASPRDGPHKRIGSIGSLTPEDRFNKIYQEELGLRSSLEKHAICSIFSNKYFPR